MLSTVFIVRHAIRSSTAFTRNLFTVVQHVLAPHTFSTVNIWFHLKKGSQQEDTLEPLLFSITIGLQPHLDSLISELTLSIDDLTFGDNQTKVAQT